MGSNQLFAVDEFQHVLGLSPLVQQFMRKEVALRETVKRRKKVLVETVGSCGLDRQEEDGKCRSDSLGTGRKVGGQRIRV